EGVHLLLAGNLHQRLRVGEEGTVAADGAGQEDAPVLGRAVGDERRVEGLLAVVHPDQLPSQVAHRERVVVLDAERAGVVERAVPPMATMGMRRAGVTVSA